MLPRPTYEDFSSSLPFPLGCTDIIHHLTFIHPTVNHGHLITGHLITLKFIHGDTLSRSRVSQEKSHNVKTAKTSACLCDKYAMLRKYTNRPT